MSNRILSYKGLLADGAQETILLSTRKGEVGYKINKFEIMGSTPGATDYEAVVKIYSIEQTVVDAVINFSEQTLLAAATYQGNSSSFNYPTTQFAIFDTIIFNQDIFITHQDLQNHEMNYYLELEVIKLDESQAMVATLKDIRNTS